MPVRDAADEGLGSLAALDLPPLLEAQLDDVLRRCDLGHGGGGSGGASAGVG